jgi:hypothetical protein
MSNSYVSDRMTTERNENDNVVHREQDQGRSMQEILNNISLKDAALYYAQNGWPVFPLAGKVPYEYLVPGLKSHGHKDATTDPATLQTWWREHPKANIGLPTGVVSGVLVVDMDVPEGHYNIKALQSTYAPLPETRRSRSGSGGLHYYFQYPRDGKRYPGAVGLAGLIGIDVRAAGNYVVLPPSRLLARKYYAWANPEQAITPAPAWLLTLLTQAEEQRHSSQQGLGFASATGEKWFAEAPDKAQEGNRNDVGFWLARMLRNDGLQKEQATRMLLLFANRVPQEHSPYTSKEALVSVKSAFSRPAQERPRRR